jgi:hypothetical protein
MSFGYQRGIKLTRRVMDPLGFCTIAVGPGSAALQYFLYLSPVIFNSSAVNDSFQQVLVHYQLTVAET